MKKSGPEFSQLLRDCGIQATYEDVTYRRRRASRETLLALLNAFGLEIHSPEQARELLHARQQARRLRGIEPVIVAWNGVLRPILITLPAQVGTDRIALHIETQDKPIESIVLLDNLPRIEDPAAESAGFITRRLPFPVKLKMGYHPLRIHAGGRILESLVLSSPRRAFRRDEPSPLGDDGAIRARPRQSTGKSSLAPNSARDWGCFLPLYALRTQNDWGFGDFSSLREFAVWAGGRSATEVGVLPLLAAFLSKPFEISPYRPASRMFWNEIYLDVEAIPEFADSESAKRTVQSADFRHRIESNRTAELADYRETMSLKRRVLETLADEFFAARPDRFADFEQFLQSHPSISDYAAFRAATERERTGWPNWPAEMCAGRLTDADFDLHAKNYHAFVQWQCDQQLTNLRRESETVHCGLYLDLPIGVDPWGYDVWRYQSSYMLGASAGAPPDVFFSKGQEWGLPPLHPERVRENGYELVRRVLETNMRFARHLRIDHMMGFHRMYCIPPGFAASQGTYIQYPADELYAVAIIESHRQRCELIGENLGTVPPAVDRALEKHGITGMWVAPYELEPGRRGLAAPLPNHAAMLNTHDMPPLAGWWRGVDIHDRRELGHIGDEHLPTEHRERDIAKRKMVDWLPAADESQHTQHIEVDPPLLPLLKQVAASPARLVVVNMEDLWLETKPQNVPGTSTERPNWQRKAKYSLEEFSNLSAVSAAMEIVAQARRTREGEAPAETFGP